MSIEIGYTGASIATQTPAAGDRYMPFFHPLTTVSREASDYLNFYVPPSDSSAIPTWDDIRAYYRGKTIEESDRARETYLASVVQDHLGGVPVLVAIPKDYSHLASQPEKVLLYIHGGAFTLGSPDHLHQIYAKTAHDTSLKTVSVDYRLAPEHPFPAGLNDCLAVYRELLKTHQPEDIFVLGDSAGANLAIATLLKARDEELALPKAVALSSPLVDTRKLGDSYDTLEGRDPKLVSYEMCVAPSIGVYVNPLEMDDPLVSVIHSDFKGFPSTLIQTGTRDILQSDSCRLNAILKKAGIKRELEVGEGHWHGMLEHNFRESDDCRDSITQFFRDHMV